MMRIGVCDDISFYVEELSACIASWAQQRNINVRIEKFATGEEVLFDLEGRGDFAVMFMDIELGGINGIEAALRLREKNRLASIVFVTQYENYLKETFCLYPCQFVEKPISRQKICRVLDRAAREQKIYYETFFFRRNRITFNIPLRQVLYFASDRRTIRIIMEGGKEHVFYEKLDRLEQRLSGYNHYFLRIHQSYLINKRQVEQFHSKHIVMRNGDILAVSRDKRNMVGQVHMELLGSLC